MLRDLTPAQRQLADYMSDLSEDAYCAGWMAGLEYALWEALLGARTGYGMLELSDEQRARLRQLSDDCAGWIVFDERAEETWLAMPDWAQQFAAWKRAGGNGGA
jgi:hypothetical protein